MITQPAADSWPSRRGSWFPSVTISRWAKPRTLHTDLGAVLHAGPLGHVLAPRKIFEAATQVCVGGKLVDRDPSAETQFVDIQGMIAVRYTLQTTFCPKWIIGLTRLRLDKSRELLRDTLDYLRHRTVAGSPLLNQQLIKGRSRKY